MFEMAKTLIVVYKDEMLVNQLKKLIETKDDIDEDKVLGTRDGSINVVAWNEKVWLGNKKAGNIKDKVLFLGDIKGTDKLIPVVDVKFNEYGVAFGWAGNQAILYTDLKMLSNRDEYKALIEEIAKLPIPDMIKKPINIRIGEADSTQKDQVENAEISEDKKKTAFLKKAKDAVKKGVDVAGKASSKAAIKAEDLLRDRSTVKRQMLFYGIVNLYNDGLDKFMNL